MVLQLTSGEEKRQFEAKANEDVNPSTMRRIFYPLLERQISTLRVSSANEEAAEQDLYLVLLKCMYYD